jgi:aspartate/tyrosine/aromatic aminotransferase
METTTMTKQEIVAQIKKTAAENYDEAYGWSVIVETMSDQDIEQEFVADGWTLQKAMSEVRSFVETMSDYYGDIKATGW